MRPNRAVVRLENFDPSEFLCRCGCGKDVSETLKIKVQAFIYKLIATYHTPIRCVISGPARCQAHNARAGGAARSLHQGHGGIDLGAEFPGAAADCVFMMLGRAGWFIIPKADIARHAIESKLFGGVGHKVYNPKFTFVHLDEGLPREF